VNGEGKHILRRLPAKGSHFSKRESSFLHNLRIVNVTRAAAAAITSTDASLPMFVANKKLASPFVSFALEGKCLHE